MAVERSAKATWEGDLFGGSGQVSTESGSVSNATVKWSSRAEQADENTSPEELIAAAHATCISMALANVLAQAGTPPQRLETEARSTFEQTADGLPEGEDAREVRAAGLGARGGVGSQPV